MQFMFNLANVDAGTTLKFSNVKVTDVTGNDKKGDSENVKVSKSI